MASRSGSSLAEERARGRVRFGSEADAHLGRCDVRSVPISRRSQIRCWARCFCLFAIKNSLFRLQGIRPKKSRVSMGLCQRGGALQLKFPVFSHVSGNFRQRRRVRCCLGQIPRSFHARGFCSNWQRQFRANSGRASPRKSLGRHLGVNVSAAGMAERASTGTHP